MTSVMLTATMGLGWWQLDRLAWKRGVLSQIEAGEHRAPSSLTGQPKAFARVVAEGEFLPGTVRYGTEIRVGSAGPMLGSHVMQTLAVEGLGPVIVDRGWATNGADVAAHPGKASVEGYIRPPEAARLFGPHDDLAKREFFTLNPETIGRALGSAHVAPYTLVVLGPGAGPPEPAHQLPRPPNDHLSYAVTWFSLAAALVGVFVVYARQVLSQGRPDEGLST